MSKAFIDRNQRQNTQGNKTDTSQKKIDPVAQLKWLNNLPVDHGFGIFNDSQPAQMFSQDEEEPIQGMAEEDLSAGAIAKEGLQMKSDSVGSSGTKTSMPEGVKSQMESSFNTDFSGVNIHTGSDQASGIGALAYTKGKDIHFASGQYNPETQKGKELLGHELAHVEQQKQGRVKPTRQTNGMSINDNPSLEKEADVMGTKAAQGKMADVKGQGSGVQMQEGDSDKLIKDEVIDQIGKTVPFPKDVNRSEMIAKAQQYIRDVDSMRQDLVTNYTQSIDIVDKYLSLKDMDIMKLFMNELVGIGIDKLGDINKTFKVCSIILKSGINIKKGYDDANSFNKQALTIIDLKQNLVSLNNSMAVAIEEIEDSIANNYDMTNVLSMQTITAEDKRKYPDATKQFEIGIWKKVLSSKWKHMVSDEETFQKDLSFISRNTSIHQNIYYTARRTSKGYYVREHWLGSGSHPMFHEKTPKELAKHLFVDLGVSRADLFENWGLSNQTYRLKVVSSPYSRGGR